MAQVRHQARISEPDRKCIEHFQALSNQLKTIVVRHGRARPGHPRLSCLSPARTWMPGTRPGMTSFVRETHFLGCTLQSDSQDDGSSIPRRKKAGLARARLKVLATRGRHNHLPRGITELSRHWRRGTNAQRKCSACKHYDPPQRLAATTRAACQSCGDRGLAEFRIRSSPRRHWRTHRFERP